MNTADLARLELAKRAYAAAQPRATEVQAGVRRARLSLRRIKSRRNWFGKGLVLVVLAVGGLAYAKPHAFGELVEGLTQASGSRAKRGGKLDGALAPAQATPKVAAASLKSAPAEVAASPELDVAPGVAPPITGKSRQERRDPSAASAARGSKASSAGVATASKAEPTAAVSDWGRVAQALGRGDETEALAALSELSQSDDQRTRDKADLGRAQLFIARGDRERGCALARSLGNRRAGSHIERQAQLLLKSCAP
ncbi:MAG TPA: hypothetical protein VNG33_02765 [Polyangiaceae bacterium]|nr:hypothetical protein [Polyangiaceae bacterium]